ncbi:hypothetical protein PI95_025990 [Hassallia byssoidea VB512170]|uniref:Uncharacterized protein n=1 Tax=Hassallia byssoidea VB512170 TaxID=1304833 RepID=A0A846HF20_9CYAN|nr:hypothetical protein [Hassalia byssoidea]NEU75916.1 hypothetical protein [Hassalia byssoidea VB512170]
MKAIQTTATVTSDGKITLQLPPDIPPGEHQVVVIIDEKLSEKEVIKEKRPPLDFPVIHVDSFPENLSLRREDMYGDDGR